MSNITLFENSNHANYLLEPFGGEEMIPANQHLIIHEGRGIILDPGGHKVYSHVLSEVSSLLKGGQLEMIFLSHQDPDIVAALNGWLMTTDAVAYSPEIWTRFIPHFGLDRFMKHRLKGIPDEGGILNLHGCELIAVPAHFLHSVGNFHLFDPVSRILYTGDLGASVGEDYRVVSDFDRHVPLMDGFHRRYMTSQRALKAWAAIARKLPVETIAPQHGAMFQGRDMVERFFAWCETLSCGVDLMDEAYPLPTQRLNP
ncbi:MAG: MBL fold metallo-hydrolase [Firmicutes bacterium]|nr:MBL fold metallo-hydrolase [Bacillota bacterium]